MPIFGPIEWINWTKWRRRGWLGVIIGALLFLVGFIKYYAIPTLRNSWPW